MPWLKRLTHNWTLKLAALGLAVLLWTVTKAETLTREVIRGVPVEVRVDDPDWVVARPPLPDSVSVTFIGPYRELFQLALARPRIVLPIDEVEDTVVLRPLRQSYLRVEGDLGRTQVEGFRPDVVRIAFERVTTRILPIAIRTRGTPPEGYRLLGSIHADPAGVRVSGPRRRIERIDSLRLRPIDLSQVTEATEMRVEIDTSGLPEGVLLSPTTVQLFVPVLPVRPDTLAVPPDTLDVSVPPDTVDAGTGRDPERRP